MDQEQNPPAKAGPNRPATTAREQRLAREAAALRANLLRRKAQARARDQAAPPPDPRDD